MTGTNTDKHPVCIPLHFYREVTLEQYQTFFDNCPICASVENEEFSNTGAYVIWDYYREDHKALMRYIKKNSSIVEIDGETLQEMGDSE